MEVNFLDTACKSILDKIIDSIIPFPIAQLGCY